MKEEILKSLGLSDKEVQVYIANLKLGSSLVQEISDYSNVNRTTCYDILRGLEQKGFVSYVVQSGKKYYQSVKPNKLIGILKEREELVRGILPELNSISEIVGKRPGVQVYVGKDGLKSIFEEILDEAKSFSCLASKDDLFNLFKYYFPHFVDRRKAKKIKVRIISNSKPHDKDALYKLVKRKFSTATWLYNGKIAMVSLEKDQLIGIVIDEKNFYQTQKMMFDLLWDSIN